MANNAYYTGITPDVFDKLRSQLSVAGIDLEGTAGKIDEKGISANYSYNEGENTLSITDVKVGFPASMMYNSDTILQKITETIEGSGGKKDA